MSTYLKSECEQDDWRKSTISRKYPTYRTKLIKTNQSWLKYKQIDDDAEGLWRIHDKLYDFSSFIKHHPGGAFWLEQTKGTDITEAFEVHHITAAPSNLLPKYEVRKAAKPRNYVFTFHDDGFYRTLKRKVALALKDLDYRPKRKSNLMHIFLLFTTLGSCLTAPLLQRFSSKILMELIAAASLCSLGIAAHNYFHRKDNWQMYTFNLTLLNFAEWRISHAMSHHIYTNSMQDLEMSLFEPFLCWLPSERYASKRQRILSVLIQPIFYVFVYPYQLVERVMHSLISKNRLYWHDVIGLSLPALMLMIAKGPFWSVLMQWWRIIHFSSFLFTLVGLNAGHHCTTAYHDGDANREDRDWGLYQLDACIDRNEIKGSHFMVLISFGEHILHHLFPTLDHGILPQLYPLLFETLKQFEEELREFSFPKQIIEQNRQLLRTKPNLRISGGKNK